MNDESFGGWVFAGIMSMITALTSTVAYLYRSLEGRNTQAIADVKEEVFSIRCELHKCEEKHDECLRDREQINITLATLKGEVSQIKKQVNE